MNLNNVFTVALIIIFSPLLGKLIKVSIEFFKLSKQYKSGNKLLDLLYRLTPREFEIWCGEYLSFLGYTNVVLSPLGPDGGKDIICIKDNITYYVECKRYYSEIEITDKEIEKLLGTLIADGIYNGIIITTTFINNEALALLENLPEKYSIELISFQNSNSYYEEYLLGFN